MSDIEARTRAALRSLADEAPSGENLWPRTHRRITARRRACRLTTAAVTMAIFVTIAVAAVVANSRHTSDLQVQGPPSSGLPTTTVSQSKTLVVVPNVLAQSEAHASRELAAKHLVAKVLGAFGLGRVGMVVAQSPPAFDTVRGGSTVRITVLLPEGGGTGPVPRTSTSLWSTPTSSQPRYAPCSASQMTALAPEWASPLTDSTDDLLRFTNKSDTCELSGYASVVAAGPGQPNVKAKPSPGFPSPNDATIVLPNGSTAQLLVAASHSCLNTAQYTTLTVAMPGGGSITVSLPKSSVSPNPEFNGRDLTLLLAPSCPPYVGYFSH